MRHYRNDTRIYEVIYDPCNTFPDGSFFSLGEVQEMLRDDYLAIGTLFRVATIDRQSRVRKTKYYEVTDDGGINSRTEEQVNRRITKCQKI